ncbi:MAG: S-layer homology domain-containing protein [Oscillospiraceae bacterium]|nr:S-layer homology domain-containing protein [Oscillospiraceae bacterium]
MALLLSLCAIGVGAATVDDFTDVSPDDWYYDAVSEVAAAGYFNGTSATTFDPQLTMTRAMFVTVLARFDGATVDNSADTTFTDVPTGQYYTGAVAWAAENGLVQGYGGNAFGTSNPITRQDMAVLMTRYIAYYEAKNSIAATTSATGTETTHDVVDDPTDFADAASIAAYATEAVVECANYGLLIGDENGNFRPTASATRAEAAAVISRLSWTVKETDKVTATGGGGGSSTTYYYLKLDLNGGTLDESVKPYSTDSKTGALIFRNTDGNFDLSTYSEAVTLANYTLARWNDSTGTEYDTAGTFTTTVTSSTNATILYAQWESNDKIGTGVVTAMEAFGEALLNGISEFKGTTIAESASETTYGAVGSVDYSAEIVGSSWSIGDWDGPDYDNKTRTVTQDLTVETGDAGSLNEITAFAIEVAKYIVVDGALSNAMLNDVIASVVDGVENATGLDISANKSVLTASIKDALHEQGGNFWTESGIGEYVDDATVKIEATGYTSELKLNVVDGAVSLDTTNVTLTEQLTDCAIALAVQMFADLQENLTATAQDSITVSPTFTVEFTLNDNNTALNAFATKYEVVSNVTFNSNNTVLFSRTGTGTADFSIALNMANETLTKKYESGFNRLLNSNRLSNLLSRYVASIIESESGSVISALNEILATAEGDNSEVSSAVTDAVTEWFVTNATSGSTETDNSAIYSLVDTLAEATIDTTVDSDYISDALTSNGVSAEDAAVITAYVDAYQTAYTEAVAKGTTLTEADIEDIKTQVAATTGNVDATIDALIEAYLSNDSSSAVAAIMVDADEFSAPVMLAGTEIDVATIMNTLNKLATVETMQSVTVSELVDILNSGLFDAYDGTVKTMVGRLSTAIDNLTAMLPASVGDMVAVNSIEINGTDVKDTLADIDSVSAFAELLNTVATTYEGVKGTALTVGDLEVVVNLEVTSTSGSYSVKPNITLSVNYDATNA